MNAGTLVWARRTNGVLSRRERLELLRLTLVQQFRVQNQLMRVRLFGGRTKPTRHLELPERLPDSSVARDAEELAREASSKALFSHCQRTYLWGHLLAQRDGKRYDEELLYVGCMLHDLGLTDSYFHPDRCACFTVEGGLAAREFAQEHGWDEHRCDALAESIVAHINAELPPDLSTEARLLTDGAGLDVIGRGYGSIDRASRDAVLERHPRLEIKAELLEVMRREAKARPKGRVALYWRMGLGPVIRAAPFES